MGKKITNFMNEFVAGLSGPANALATTNGDQMIADAPISPELKNALETLMDSISTARDHLSDKQASRFMHDVESLVSELSSDEPRREWYTLSLRGLKEGALNTGAFARPILDSVTNIGAMLGIAV